MSSISASFFNNLTHWPIMQYIKEYQAALPAADLEKVSELV